jgi:hypothetical protein
MSILLDFRHYLIDSPGCLQKPHRFGCQTQPSVLSLPLVIHVVKHMAYLTIVNFDILVCPS